jgi:hypothetical protein
MKFLESIIILEACLYERKLVQLHWDLRDEPRVLAAVALPPASSATAGVTVTTKPRESGAGGVSNIENLLSFFAMLRLTSRIILKLRAFPVKGWASV